MSEGQDIVRYADAAMYDAQPILKEGDLRITPKVFLLTATPDPLGAIAADMRMYRGDPVYDMSEITDDQRTWAWEEVMKTHLNTPLEGVSVKIMIEAVTRSFTHQMVRQRVGAYYVQESLRFAVKKGIAKECALPPSVMDLGEPWADSLHPTPGQEASQVWHDVIADIQAAYEKLIALGIPAEDARGILPHCVTTRILYNTNLRGLFEHAGNRLCTQAQFEWRAVFMGIMTAMRDYQHKHRPKTTGGQWAGLVYDNWQWQLIAEPRANSFTPICYRLGRCAFMSQLDRGCTIRDRVEQFHRAGIPSEKWNQDHHSRFVGEVVPGTFGERIEGGQVMYGISPAEWLADPYAGITNEGNRPT